MTRAFESAKGLGLGTIPPGRVDHACADCNFSGRRRTPCCDGWRTDGIANAPVRLPSPTLGRVRRAAAGPLWAAFRFQWFFREYRGVADSPSLYRRSGGDGGIRTLDTGFSPYAPLAGECLRPLGHVSFDCLRPGLPRSASRGQPTCANPPFYRSPGGVAMRSDKHGGPPGRVQSCRAIRRSATPAAGRGSPDR